MVVQRILLRWRLYGEPIPTVQPKARRLSASEPTDLIPLCNVAPFNTDGYLRSARWLLQATGLFVSAADMGERVMVGDCISCCCLGDSRRTRLKL
jgi:hypothetical protein